MAITSVTNISSTESVDANGDQTYVNTYEVISNLATENPITVRQALSVAYGDTYSWGTVSNSNAYCVGLSTQMRDPDETRYPWRVTATFSTKQPAGRPISSGLVQDPQQEPWRISGSYATSTRQATYDRNDRAITNSAHEPKVLEVPDGYDTLRLSGPSLTISLSTRAAAVICCNSATIWGLTARKVFLAQWSYEIRNTGSNGSYVWNDLEFWIRDDLWNEVFLDQGTREYLGAATSTEIAKRYRTITGLGDAPTGGWLLNGAGRLIDGSTSDGFYITREVIEEYDFTTLGLPNPLPGPFV